MKVAILEDDPAQAELVTDALQSAGHICVVFATMPAIMTKLRQETFDLLVLDWNVPQGSGVDVAAWAREHLKPTPPILMVTARAESDDVVAALNAGADDFIVKPVEKPILVARVAALLRRAYPVEEIHGPQTLAGFAFDPIALTVTPDGQPAVDMTAKEFALALVFFRNLHRPLGRAWLLETVWGRNPDLATRTLDAHVSKIRTKLGLRPDIGFKLSPVYSYGYRLERLSDEEAPSA